MSVRGKVQQHLQQALMAFWPEDPIERKKTYLLAFCFLVGIGCYTLVKELKDLIFINIVGLEAVPEAKILSLLVLIPMVFIYARFVDVMRRHQLLCFYSLAYSIGGLICAYFIGHPTIGLGNTDTGRGRLFGWIFYFFIEGYQPFLVSVLWSFVNSITKPEDVKSGYIVMTAFSKLGGVITAGLAWFFLSWQGNPSIACLSCVASYQFLLISSSLVLLVVPLTILYFKRVIPASYIHGYEAAYQFEKHRMHQTETILSKQNWWQSLKSSLSSMFSGLYLLLRYPYVMGIFGMIFFWEIINVIFNYIRLEIGQKASGSALEFGSYLYQQTCLMHIVGLTMVLVGTSTIVSWLGERRSLIAVPVLIGLVITYYLSVQTMAAATLAYLVMRAINYAFAYPLRESLYIPTTKDVKFKSKSWIDGFGSKLSKGFGSGYNIVVRSVSQNMLFSVHMTFFAIIIGLWSVMAHFLGRRYETVVAHNEVIGVEKS